jgi:hypothetical protein
MDIVKDKTSRTSTLQSSKSGTITIYLIYGLVVAVSIIFIRENETCSLVDKQIVL